MVLILELFAVELLSLEPSLQEHLEELYLWVFQFWVPNIDDQVDSCVLPVMPRLMVERIVEYYAFVLLQVLLFVTYAH